MQCVSLEPAPNTIPEMWQVAGALHVLQAKGLWPALKNAYYDSLNVPPGLVLTCSFLGRNEIGDPIQVRSHGRVRTSRNKIMMLSLSLSLGNDCKMIYFHT